MTYSEESLGHNEKLIYQAHFHPLYYVAAWGALIFFLALAFWSIIYADEIMKWVLLGVRAAGHAVLAVRVYRSGRQRSLSPTTGWC